MSQGNESGMLGSNRNCLKTIFFFFTENNAPSAGTFPDFKCLPRAVPDMYGIFIGSGSSLFLDRSRD